MDLQFADLDLDRKKRTGFAEVVFCPGKSDDALRTIFQKLFEAEGEVIGTRASAHQAEVVKSVLPDAEYDEISRILKIESDEKKSG